MKNILLISTVNLFNNPRLVKEICFFQEQQYTVYVICFDVGFGDDKSLEIEKKFPKISHFLDIQRKVTSKS